MLEWTLPVAILIGALTGLIPGLHVNLLAALALAMPGMEKWSLALIVIGVVHTFVTILPTTYLGAPDGDTAMSVLPAHRMVMAGDGRLAIRLSLQASMLAALATVLLLLPYHWVLTQPATLPVLQLLAPWILLAIPTWLASRSGAWAFLVAGLAAGLGWLAFAWPVHGPLPGSPLLPLLSGLFGVPTLLSRQGRLPWQAPPRHWPVPVASTLRGVIASAATAILPGVTAAVATAVSTRGDERQVLATMSAVNTAHLIFAMGVLWITGRTRSGLAIAWASWNEPGPWIGFPPADLVSVMAAVLVAGAAAVGLTLLLDQPYLRLIQRMQTGWPERAAIVCIIALVAATTGWLGLLLLATSTCIGLIPIQLGLPRIHLAACLAIPIAIKLL